MKRILVGGLLLVAAAAFPQSPDPKRVDAIWDAAKDRLARQTDAWFKAGDFPRSVQLLKFQFQLDPTNYEIGTNLGWMLENIDQYDKALAVYIQFRNANPNQPDDAWPEANFYFMKKAYAKVPPILEPTIKNHNPQPNNYRTLADAYEKMNMFADSKRVWELYLSKHPEDAPGKAHLQRILKKLAGGTTGKKT